MNQTMDKIVHKNYKKALIRYFIIAIVFVAVAIGTGIGVFGSRIKTVVDAKEQREKITFEMSQTEDGEQAETQYQGKEHEENEHDKKEHRNEHDKKKLEWKEFDLEDVVDITTGEKVLIGGFLIIGVIIGVIYWLLIIGLTLKLAYNVDADLFIFGLLALFLNVGAIILLYMYKHFSVVCDHCGKIQKRKAIFCSSCGKHLKKRCEECGNLIKANDKFCSQCGKEFK